MSEGDCNSDGIGGPPLSFISIVGTVDVVQLTGAGQTVGQTAGQGMQQGLQHRRRNK
jgi:hypothetical protein